MTSLFTIMRTITGWQVFWKSEEDKNLTRHHQHVCSSRLNAKRNSFRVKETSISLMDHQLECFRDECKAQQVRAKVLDCQDNLINRCRTFLGRVTAFRCTFFFRKCSPTDNHFFLYIHPYLFYSPSRCSKPIFLLSSLKYKRFFFLPIQWMSGSFNVICFQMYFEISYLEFVEERNA